VIVMVTVMIWVVCELYVSGVGSRSLTHIIKAHKRVCCVAAAAVVVIVCC